MSTVIIKSNASQGTDVLIPDMGIIIPNSGGAETFTDTGNIQNAYESQDLRTLCTDDAHGVGSSTVILNDGASDIPQADIDEFLAEAAGVKGETGTAGDTGPAGAGETGLQGVTGNANFGRGTPFPAIPEDRELFWFHDEQTLYFYEGVTAMAWIDISSGSLRGLTGIQGLTGIPGTAAAQGVTGSQGTTGVQGQTGLQGATGIQGVTGAQGTTGIQGQTGLQGATGAQGTTGFQGQTGLQGTTGLSGVTGLQGSRSFQFFADMMDAPVSGDWAVTGIAPLAADSNNSGLLVRLYDDTVEEGSGFLVEIPEGSTNMAVEIRSRAETAPGTTDGVVPKLYVREVPDNASVEAWSAGTELTTISIPTNENFQYDTQTIALSSLSLVAGRVAQFELTRNPGAGADDLSGDWVLLEVKITFS